MAGPKKKKKLKKKGAGGDKSAALMAAATQSAGLAPGAQSNPRYQAAQSMLSQGVQSLSGLSGAQGQVNRFKTEQKNLINEYNNDNTSDDRKKEIIKDLRGVSSDLNEANKNAAFNYIIREFGPNAVLPGGSGLMGLDVGQAFQNYRDQFGDIQQQFKTVNPKLFKQVHANPFLKLLGSAAQITNLTPTGIIRNLNKIRKGEPLIDLDFMKKNTSESPSRLKNFYNAYMNTVNKEIQKETNKKFDKVPIDKGFQDALGINQPDFSSDKDYLLPGGTEEATLAGQEPYDPAIAEDKEAQEEIERSLLNQYSLLGDSDLATSLLDDTEETSLEEAINPVVEDREKINIDESLPLGNISSPNIFDPLVEAEKDEYLDTYGAGSVPYNLAKQMQKERYERKAETDEDYREGGRFDFDKETPGAQSFFDFHEKTGLSPNRQREYIMDIIDPNYSPYFTERMPYQYRDRFGALGNEADFSGFQDVPYNTGNIPVEQFKDVLVPGDPRLPIPPFSFPGLEPQTFKDGGSVDTYDVLKLINDTMNDG